MAHKKGRIFYTLLLLLCGLGISTLTIAASLSAKKMYTREEIANALQWTPTQGNCDLCDGHYQKAPRIVRDHPFPKSARQEITHISSTGPTEFSKKGWSLLQGHVVVTQVGRIVTANKAYVFRDAKTGKVTRIRLVGNVHLQEYGKLIVAPKVVLNLRNKTVVFDHAIYHFKDGTALKALSSSKRVKGMKPKFDAWGTANHIYKAKSGLIQLWDAVYTTCSPLNPAWKIEAKYLKINRTTGLGIAKDAVVKLKNVPILYTPYLRFPIDNRRKTGFLGITLGSSSNKGFETSLPFYWNIAPNFDATITPTLMTSRGFMMSALFRYLTHTSTGSIYASGLPDDRGFTNFKNQTLANLNSAGNTGLYAPYIASLNREGNNRGFVSVNNASRFGNDWTSNLTLNLVSDPYYFNDFGNTYNQLTTNQLLNQLMVQYNNPNWTVTGLIQAYQTLHLVTQLDNPVLNQYTRLPEFDAEGNYPDLIASTNVSVSAQAVNFEYDSAFQPFTYQIPIGQRFHLRPSISRPFNWASGFLVPQVSIDNTDYITQLAQPTPFVGRPQYQASRNIPIADVNAGFYFNRDFDWDHQEYIQTFEPHLFYLYVPFVSQNQYPVFDTVLLPFTFEQLYAVNEYTGFDRLQNANQLSIGFTSRILNEETGAQEFKMDAGFIYYFTQPQVTLPGVTTPSGTISPLVGDLTYYPNQHWSTTGTIAWDTSAEQINNAGLSVRYKGFNQAILGLGYTYVREIDGIPVSSLGVDDDTNLVDISLSWPLTKRWSTVGYWYYNVAQHHPQGYYAGLQYSTCCWAVRFIASRSFLGLAPTGVGTQVTNDYNTTYYVQVLLKGLGSFGNSAPGELLTSTIPGYQDPFANNV